MLIKKCRSITIAELFILYPRHWGDCAVQVRRMLEVLYKHLTTRVRPNWIRIRFCVGLQWAPNWKLDTVHGAQFWTIWATVEVSKIHYIR